MRNWILANIVTLWATGAVAAISPEDMRDLAYAKDYTAVELAFRQAHSESLSGDISYDELRVLMTSVLTSHPDMVDFVEDWAAQSPQSPYALTARAFQHYYRAFDLRGEGRGSDVHAFAHYTFRGSHETGFADAMRARYLAPDFVPASDAVFVLNATTRQLGFWDVDAFIQETMTQTPNLGSLRRIAALSNRAWGGSGYRFNVALCGDYADRLRDAPNLSAKACAVHLMADEKQLDENWAFVNEVLDSEDHPALDYARVFRAILLERHEDWQLIEAYLDKQTFDDPWVSMKIWIAHVYSRRFPIPETRREKLADYQDRLLAGTKAQLVHDPFRTSLLKVATNDFPMFTNRSTKYTDEYKMYQRRLVAVQPFNPERWNALRYGEPSYIGPDTIFLQDGSYINAIYYSGHDIEYVEGFLNNQSFKYRRYFDYNWTGYHGNVEYASEDVVRNVIGCRIARLMRVFEVITENDPDHVDYGRDRLQSASMRDLRVHITENSACGDVWTAPVETLFFAPVAVDLEPLLELPNPDG